MLFTSANIPDVCSVSQAHRLGDGDGAPLLGEEVPGLGHAVGAPRVPAEQPGQCGLQTKVRNLLTMEKEMFKLNFPVTWFFYQHF